MARFFINRPIVAIVIAILTVLGGLIAMLGLPVAQFPDIVPPLIQIQTSYPGADALTIEQSVATPIEQQMNGVEDMLYLQSVNANDGTITVRVTFDVGTDRNADQVNAQNRVAQALPSLPVEVNQFGLTYRKTQGTPLDPHLALLAEGDVRRPVSGELRAHQRQRRPLPGNRRRAGPQLRRVRVRDADLGPSGPAREARPDGRRPACAPSSSRAR